MLVIVIVCLKGMQGNVLVTNNLPRAKKSYPRGLVRAKTHQVNLQFYNSAGNIIYKLLICLLSC